VAPRHNPAEVHPPGSGKWVEPGCPRIAFASAWRGRERGRELAVQAVRAARTHGMDRLVEEVEGLLGRM
jgi:hypothetical protein